MTIRSGLAARDVDAGSWDRLARRGFHRHAWFRLAEESGHEPRHVVVLEADTPRAIFPAFRQERVLHGDLASRWLGPLQAPLHAAGVRLRPSLAVVLPFGQSSQPPGDPAALTENDLHAVFEALEEIARRDRCRAIVLPYVDPGAEPLRRAARARGYVEAFAGSTASLDVAWDTFDAYLASRSKSVRRTIRLEIEQLESLGVRVSQETELGELASPIDDLYRGWYRWRNGREPELPVSFFADLGKRTGSAIGAQITRVGDRLAAVSVWAEAGGVMDSGFVAFADRRLGAIYFNELIYAPLRLACERGWTRLELGPSSLAPKVLRGATIRPRITLARGTSPAAHASVRALAHLVSARNRAKERP
jgi:predicted N-acyltransferase